MKGKYIDLHIHGGYGTDLMKADAEDISKLSILLQKDGAAAWMPTLIGDDIDVLERRVKAIADAAKTKNGAVILGVHIEGPFISPFKCGVLPAENIVPCDIKYFDRLSKYGLPLRFTVAPEAEKAPEFIKYVTENGGTVTLGHSDDDGVMTLKALSMGAVGFTHLFNAMKGLHHRNGSIAEAALLSGMPCEVIADMHHLSPNMIRLIYKTVGLENIVLVTDAMSAMQSNEGIYEFCGKKVHFDGSTVSVDGILAGSCLTMENAVKNFCAAVGEDEETVQKQMIKNSLRMIKQTGEF